MLPPVRSALPDWQRLILAAWSFSFSAGSWLAEEEWALEYEELPSIFRDFDSDQKMQERLPPQLCGTLRMVQV